MPITEAKPLKKKPFKKVVIIALSFIVLLIGISVINEKTRFTYRVNQKVGEVAGVFVVDKFLDSLIPDTVSAQVPSPYQDISGAVTITGDVTVTSTNPKLTFDETDSVPWQWIVGGDQWIVQRNGVDKFVITGENLYFKQAYLQNNEDSIVHVWASAANSKLSLGAGGGNDYLNILSDGKVGIGTNDPQATLDVNGMIKIQVDNTTYTSGLNDTPEVYKITSGGPSCTTSTRGSMFVGRPSGAGGNQDALCVCMNISGSMDWWCFNP